MGIGIMQLARGDKPPSRSRPIMLLDQQPSQQSTHSTSQQTVQPTPQQSEQSLFDEPTPNALSNVNIMNGVSSASIHGHGPTNGPLLNNIPVIPHHNSNLPNLPNVPNLSSLPQFHMPFSLQPPPNPSNHQALPFQTHNRQLPQLHPPFPLLHMGLNHKFRIKPPPGLQLLSSDDRKLPVSSTDLLRRTKTLLKNGYTIMAPEPSAGFKSSWGLMLQEMNWMATDYHQERVWKRRVSEAIKTGMKRMIQQRELERKGWAANQAARIVSQWWQQLDSLAQDVKTKVFPTDEDLDRKRSSFGAVNRTRLLTCPLYNYNKQKWQIGLQTPELIRYCTTVQVHAEALQMEQSDIHVELEPLDIPEQLFIPVSKVSEVDSFKNKNAAVDQYVSRMEASGAKVHPITFRPPDDEIDSVSLVLNSDEDYSPLLLHNYVLRKSSMISLFGLDSRADKMPFNRFKPYLGHLPLKHMPLPIKSFPPTKPPITMHPPQNLSSTSSANASAHLPITAVSTCAVNTTDLASATVGSGCVKQSYLLSHLMQKYDMVDGEINWDLLATAMEMHGGTNISVDKLKKLYDKIDVSYPKTPLVKTDELFGMVYNSNSDGDLQFDAPVWSCDVADDALAERMINQVANSRLEEPAQFSNNIEGMFERNCNVKTYERIEQLASKSMDVFIEWYSHVDPKVAGQANLLENSDDLLPPFLACVALKYPNNTSIIPI